VGVAKRFGKNWIPIIFGFNKCYEQLSSMTIFFSPVKINTFVVNIICQYESFICYCIKIFNSCWTSGKTSKRVRTIYLICVLQKTISLLNYHLCLNIRSNNCGMHVIKYKEAESEYDWFPICEVRVHANTALFCSHLEICSHIFILLILNAGHESRAVEKDSWFTNEC